MRQLKMFAESFKQQAKKLHPHRFHHAFGTEIMRRGVKPLYGKELMGIKSDRVLQRYIRGVLKQAAAQAYLEAIGEAEDENN